MFSFRDDLSQHIHRIPASSLVLIYLDCKVAVMYLSLDDGSKEGNQQGCRLQIRDSTLKIQIQNPDPDSSQKKT